MEEVQCAESQQQSSPKRSHQGSAASNIKRECLSFTTSLQEGLRYIKAIFVGQVILTSLLSLDTPHPPQTPDTQKL